MRPLLSATFGLALLAPTAAAQQPDWSVVPAVAVTPPFAPPALAHVVLPGGLRVLSVARPGAPLVQLSLALDVGSADDPADRRGLAALAANLLPAGTRTRGRDAIALATEGRGGALEVSVGRHQTVLRLVAAPADLDSAMALLADVALRPAWTPAAIEDGRRARLAVIAQWPERLYTLTAFGFWRTVYGPAHPYARSGDGFPGDLAAITRDDLLAWHRRHVAPRRATLVVVGPPAMAQVTALAARHFGAGWPTGGAAPTRTIPAPQPLADPGVLLIHRPGAVQSAIRIGGGAPSLASADLAAARVFNMILGGASSSRLERNLRGTHGYTYEARTTLDAQRAGGHFSADPDVETKFTGAALREALAEFDRVRTDIGDDEIEAAKRILIRGFPGRFVTVRDVADVITEQLIAEPGLTRIRTPEEELAGVTRADVLRIAQRLAASERRVIVIVGDSTAVAPQLRSLGIGPLRIVPVDAMITPPR